MKHPSALLRPLPPIVDAVRTVSVAVGWSILLPPSASGSFSSPRFILSARLSVRASFPAVRPASFAVGLSILLPPIIAAVRTISVAVGWSILLPPSASGSFHRRGSYSQRCCRLSRLLRPYTGSFHRRGSYCPRRCRFEHPSDPFGPLAPFSAAGRIAVVSSGLMLSLGLWLFSSPSVAVGLSRLLSSSRFVLSVSLLVRAFCCLPSAPGPFPHHDSCCQRRCLPSASGSLHPHGSCWQRLSMLRLPFVLWLLSLPRFVLHWRLRTL